MVEAQVLVFVLNHVGLNPTNPAGSRVAPGEFEVRAQTSRRRWWGGDPLSLPDVQNLLHQTSTESGALCNPVANGLSILSHPPYIPMVNGPRVPVMCGS
jgi:hypothetical protein